jgi:hypothetical protein
MEKREVWEREVTGGDLGEKESPRERETRRGREGKSGDFLIL